MITGRVTPNREAVIDLEVGDAIGQTQQVQAVIDTGYNGYLTLPGNAIRSLQLPFAGHRRGILADGSVLVLDVYLGSASWHGRPLDVLIAQADGTPLVGMSLLRGSRMTVDVIDDGDVVIQELQ